MPPRLGKTHRLASDNKVKDHQPHTAPQDRRGRSENLKDEGWAPPVPRRNNPTARAVREVGGGGNEGAAGTGARQPRGIPVPDVNIPH